jgi:branched-chain amino acid transport system ATP-binding protein
MPDAPLLEIRDVWKAFGGVQAVAGVSAAIGAGEIQAVIGPNGAGKTTLFNLVTGHLPCDRGQIVFRGEPIAGVAPHRVWRRGISRTFQVPAVFGSLSARENVQVALLSRERRSRNLTADAAGLYRRPAEVLLGQVGLLGRAEERCGRLSHGELKRMELALALAGEPSLLLLDEPAAGLAPDERVEIMLLVSRVVDERKLTVLFTEHDMDVVFATATRILVMDRGRVVAEGVPQAVREDPEVQRVYLGGML